MKIIVPITLSLVATLIAVVASRLITHAAPRAQPPGMDAEAAPAPAI